MGLLVSFEVDLAASSLGDVEEALQAARACLARVGHTELRRVRLVGRAHKSLSREVVAALTKDDVTRRQAKALGQVRRIAEDIRVQVHPVPADIADALKALVKAIEGAP